VTVVDMTVQQITTDLYQTINMELHGELQREYPYLFGLIAREVLCRVYDEQEWARGLRVLKGLEIDDLQM